ncbi:helix-turn-helix transcriptional regulator [Fodinicola feengrottensis]
MSEVGDYVRTARVSHNWTQEQLAVLVGVSLRTLSKWENGADIPRGRVLVLEKVLGVSLDTAVWELHEAAKAAHASYVVQDALAKDARTALESHEELLAAHGNAHGFDQAYEALAAQATELAAAAQEATRTAAQAERMWQHREDALRAHKRYVHPDAADLSRISDGALLEEISRRLAAVRD